MPEVAPQAERKGDAKQNEHAVWLNRQTGDSVDDTRAAENARNEIDEIDRLACSVSYQKAAAAVRESAREEIDGLEDALLAEPTEGPAVALATARVSLRARIEEARGRQRQIDPTRSSELYRRYSQFREQLERKLDRLEIDDEPDKLVKLGAWRATITAISALFRANTDARVRTVQALSRGDPLSRNLAEHLDRVRAITFPCLEFRNDPIGYIHTILGEDPWQVEGEDGQITLVLSVRDHKFTLAPSGRGLGKTKAVAWICNWWRDTRKQGRVCISNFTGNQLRTQDWAEILRCIYNSGICWDCKQQGVTERPCPHSQCIPQDEVSETPTKGIWSADKERFIVGITGNDAQSLGGYHGEELLVICDEFSGTTQDMFDVWERNVSGPENRFLGPGNPLDGPGSPMHDMVTDERIRKLYNANVVNLDGEVAARAGKSYLPTAESNKILELKDQRGRESPEYMIGVRGKYPTRDQYSVFQPGQIIKASDPELYKLASPTGPFVIGIDPSGETTAAHDMGVIVVLRGLVVLEWRQSYHWTMDDYLLECLDAWRAWRNADTEYPLIGIDCDGVGSRVRTRFDNYLASARTAAHEKCAFTLMPVYFGHEASNWKEYDLSGDEGRSLVARWLNAGGVFPHNQLVIQEMQHTRWHYVRKHRHDGWEDQLLSATRKDSTPDCYRKVIGRSPDHLDALTVAIMAAHNAELGILPDARGELEKQDEEMAVVETVDGKLALRNYMREIRKGRYR